MQSVCFIVNSQKKKVENLVAQVESVFKGRYRVEFLYTKGSRDAERLAVKAFNMGCSYLVAVGGDGTVNEVVNGLMQLPAEKRMQVAVAVLPWGTGNDFARSVGATSSIEQLYGLLERGNICCVDVGQVHYTQPNGLDALRYFVNIGDIGVGPSTVLMVERLKKLVGPTVAFWVGSFCTIFFRRSKEVAVEADGYSYKGRAMAVCMANGRFFGSGLGIAPRAIVNDGLLNLVVVGRISAWTFLRFTGKLRGAHPIRHSEVHYVDTARCRILSAAMDCPLELDGEVLGSAPLEVELLPGAIRCVVDVDRSRAVCKALIAKKGALIYEGVTVFD